MTAIVGLRGHRMDQVSVGIEGAKTSGLVEQHVRLNALECLVEVGQRSQVEAVQDMAECFGTFERDGHHLRILSQGCLSC